MSGEMPPQQGPAVQPLSPGDERTWMTLIDVGGIFLYFLPALIGYAVLRDRSAFVRRGSASALNFQITMALASVVSSVLIVVGIGFLLLPAVYVLIVVFSIIAAVRANRGEDYVYPLAIPLVS